MLGPVVILLGSICILSACAAPKIRQPQYRDTPESFWDAFDWEDLAPAEKALWERLGWDEASWEGYADEPISEGKLWRELTDEERGAAEQLGYNRVYWDNS